MAKAPRDIMRTRSFQRGAGLSGRPFRRMRRSDAGAYSALRLYVNLWIMTDDDLISFAQSLPETVESSHFGNRDFRVRGKIYLTLPSSEFCVVKLTPDQQQMVLATVPEHILAVPGAWGLKGWTQLFHHMLDDGTMRALVRQGWRNVAPKSMALPED